MSWQVYTRMRQNSHTGSHDCSDLIWSEWRLMVDGREGLRVRAGLSGGGEGVRRMMVRLDKLLEEWLHDRSTLRIAVSLSKVLLHRPAFNVYTRTHTQTTKHSHQINTKTRQINSYRLREVFLYNLSTVYRATLHPIRFHPAVKRCNISLRYKALVDV